MAKDGIRVHIYGDYDNKDIDKAIRDLKSLKTSADQTEQRFSGLSTGMKVAGAAIAAAAAAAAYGVVRFAGQSIEAASNLEESLSKARTVFGNASGAVEQFAKDAATNLGLSEQAALEATGTFGNLFTAMGIGQGTASTLSRDVVQLAADLASFNNIDVQSALDALRSGLVGETEPLRRLGVNLSAARIETEAFRLGLAKTKDDLNAASKAQAAWSLITQDAATASGDFARTSDSLANTQRTLTAAVDNARASIGEGLVNALQDVISTAGGPAGAANAIETFGDRIGLFVEGLTMAVSGLEDMNIAVDDQRQEIRRLAQVYDDAGGGLRGFIAIVRNMEFDSTISPLEVITQARRNTEQATEAWADYRRAQQGVVQVTPAVVAGLNATADAAAGAARSGAAAARALLEYAISTGQVPSAARFAQRFDVKEMLEGVGKAASATGSSSRGAKDDVEKLDRKVKQVLPELAEVAAQFGIKVNEGLKIKGDKDFLESVKKRFDVIKERVSDFTSSRDSFQSDVQSIMSGWLSIGNAAEAYYARQKAVVDAEAELNKYRMSLTDEVTDSQKERLAELQLAYDNASSAARNGAQSIVDEFVQQSEKFGKFGEKMQQLLAANLNKTSFRQILEMGADRGSDVADYYLNGNTQELVNRTNQTMEAYNQLTDTIAAQSATAFYQAGLQSVVAMLRAFIETLGTGGKARRELRSLMDSLQKELEINVKVNVPTPSGGGGGGGPVDFTPVQQAVEQVAASIAPRPMGAYTPPLPSMGPVIPSGEGRIFAELAALNRGRAAGGPVTGGQPYLVGEIGPELFVPSVSGTIVPNKALGGSTSITINVNAGMGTNGAEVGRQIVDALKAYERRNGPVYAQA